MSRLLRLLRLLAHYDDESAYFVVMPDDAVKAQRKLLRREGFEIVGYPSGKVHLQEADQYNPKSDREA